MIRMSKLTDYAILLLAHLTRAAGGTLTAQELASRSRVPLPTVSKLAKELSKAGLVISHRGRNGGYGLARPADQISVAEIVEALEGPIALTECTKPGKIDCAIEDTCLAKASWDPVSHAIESALRGKGRLTERLTRLLAPSAPTSQSAVTALFPAFSVQADRPRSTAVTRSATSSAPASLASFNSDRSKVRRELTRSGGVSGAVRARGTSTPCRPSENLLTAISLPAGAAPPINP